MRYGRRKVFRQPRDAHEAKEKLRELTMTKPPPVPYENQSHKGPGDPKSGNPHQACRKKQIEKPDQQAHQGNTRQNTTHQGYQQDR